jgi:heat shock protein 5
MIFYSGKSESITITNEKGRLSQEEIDRMVREAEEFASEDEAQRKRIEALNGLQNFVRPHLLPLHPSTN